MGRRIRQRTVESNMDQKILIGMIVSTKFCLDVSQMLNINYFRTKHAQIIAKWIIRYFKKYRTAPEQSIKDIYEAEQDTLGEEEAEKQLSIAYESSGGVGWDNFADLSAAFAWDDTLQGRDYWGGLHVISKGGSFNV